MKKLLKICRKCNIYTLKNECQSCHSQTISPHPAKFSPDDRYLRYRVASRYQLGQDARTPAEH